MKGKMMGYLLALIMFADSVFLLIGIFGLTIHRVGWREISTRAIGETLSSPGGRVVLAVFGTIALGASIFWRKARSSTMEVISLRK